MLAKGLSEDGAAQALGWAKARVTARVQIKAADLAERKKQERKRTGGAPIDPIAEAKRERDQQLRELADRAHGVNLDLGACLLSGLSAVDPSDLDVARFFTLGRYRPRTNWADAATMPIRCARTAPTDRRLLGESAQRHSRPSREWEVRSPCAAASRIPSVAGLGAMCSFSPRERECSTGGSTATHGSAAARRIRSSTGAFAGGSLSETARRSALTSLAAPIVVSVSKDQRTPGQVPPALVRSSLIGGEPACCSVCPGDAGPGVPAWLEASRARDVTCMPSDDVARVLTLIRGHRTWIVLPRSTSSMSA